MCEQFWARRVCNCKQVKHFDNLDKYKSSLYYNSTVFQGDDCDVDVDECEINNVSYSFTTTTNSKNSCDPSSQICVNTRASNRNPLGHYCKCKDPGYRTQPNNDFRKSPFSSICVDIDECREHPNICGNSGKCQNLPGSYRCQCKGNLVWDDKRKKCEPRNDFLKDADFFVTQANTLSKNNNNKFDSNKSKNKCEQGYSYNTRSRSCQDINECLKNPSICGANSICINIIGSYRCTCRPNFVKDRKTKSCVPKPLKCCDFEDVGQNPCENRLDGGVCVDTNEITESNHMFECVCPDGLVKRRKSFENYKKFSWANKNSLAPFQCIKEEQEKQTTVATTPPPVIIEKPKPGPKIFKDVPSINIEMEVPIICDLGYESNGKKCVDIDECSRGTHNCPYPRSLCRNVDGGYICECSEGYVNDKPKELWWGV